MGGVTESIGVGTLNDKGRDYGLENAKAILIVLVAYAHSITGVFGGGTQLASILWGVINAFHMAAFLIISGYLSASRIDNKEFFKVISKNFIPYLFAQFGLFLMFALTGTLSNFFITADSNSMSWLRPSGALWYIFAVGIYVTATSILKDYFKDRLGLLFIISICCCLLMGFGKIVWYFRFTKMVAFYPYFLLGYIMRKKKEGRLFGFINRGVGAVFLVGGIGLMVLLRHLFFHKINFTGIITMEDKGQYATLYEGEYQNIIGPFARLILITLAIIVAIGIIAVMPNKKRFYTPLGTHSIYIYVLHWYVYRLIAVVSHKTGGTLLSTLKGFFNQGTNILIYGLPIVIGLCVILQLKPIRTIFRPFLEPRIKNRFIIDGDIK